MSNQPELGTGQDIWESMVKPRRETPRSLVSQALLTLQLTDRLPRDGSEAVATWPGVSVAVRLDRDAGNGLAGTAVIGYHLQTARETLAVEYHPAQHADPFEGCVSLTPAGSATEEGFCFHSLGLPVNKRQALADAFACHAAARAFTAMLDEAAVARRLVTELQEAQSTLNLAPLWLHLWPGLVWHDVFEVPLTGKRAALLRLFLLEAGRNSPVKAALEAQLAEETARRIADPDPDHATLARLVGRTADLDLHPDWWAAQNALWERRPWTGKTADLARALGFAVQA